MTQQNPPSTNVRIKFSIDSSSKEAVDKFEAKKFRESVKKDSAVITRKSLKTSSF